RGGRRGGADGAAARHGHPGRHPHRHQLALQPPRPALEAYRRHYGKDGDPVLIWQAPSRTMNSTLPEHVVQAALEADEAAARAEYLAQFRADISAFITRDLLDACVVTDRSTLPPLPGATYVGFTDPSGGSHDSMTMAIAHRVTGPTGQERVVIDLVAERR